MLRTLLFAMTLLAFSPCFAQDKNNNNSIANKVAPFLKIFPNPASNELNIESDHVIGQLRIVNILGQTVYSGKFETKVVKIDISGLPPGMYYAQFADTAPQKVIKP
jgi:hypothetical protein